MRPVYNRHQMSETKTSVPSEGASESSSSLPFNPGKKEPSQQKKTRILLNVMEVFSLARLDLSAKIVNRQ